MYYSAPPTIMRNLAQPPEPNRLRPVVVACRPAGAQRRRRPLWAEFRRMAPMRLTEIPEKRWEVIAAWLPGHQPRGICPSGGGQSASRGHTLLAGALSR
jgi:hypothetical protein